MYVCTASERVFARRPGLAPLHSPRSAGGRVRMQQRPCPPQQRARSAQQHPQHQQHAHCERWMCSAWYGAARTHTIREHTRMDRRLMSFARCMCRYRHSKQLVGKGGAQAGEPAAALHGRCRANQVCGLPGLGGAVVCLHSWLAVRSGRAGSALRLPKSPAGCVGKFP
jgi:hypothetical protein